MVFRICPDDDKEFDVIYTDFIKTFDKVDHYILLINLQGLGINGKFLDWFGKYVDDRSEAVCLSGI